MARANSVAPRRMMASMSLGVTTRGRLVCRASPASITVGTPTATTGTPRRAGVRGWASRGHSPAVESCTLHPSRRTSLVHRLSTATTAAGSSRRIRLCSSSTVARPVVPSTPGAKAATGRRVMSSSFLGAVWHRLRVTNTRSAVSGPRASAVTARLPTPATSTSPSLGSRARIWLAMAHT